MDVYLFPGQGNYGGMSTPAKSVCLKYYRDYQGYYVWVDEGDSHQRGITRHKSLNEARERIDLLQKNFGIAFGKEDLSELPA